jgi:glycosyltransferase involved in cell wall biosynthesis
VTVPALCEALGRIGHDVKLFATRHGGVVDGPPIDYELLTFPATNGLGRVGFSPPMHRALAREMAESAVVHSHGLWLWTNYEAHLAASRSAKPHVLSPRGMLEPYALQRTRVLKRIVWLLGQHKAIRSASCLHVTAASELASVRALGLRNPVALVPNGVQIPPAGARVQSAQRRMVFLGRIDHVKGVDLLIHAWSHVASEFPAWSVDLVGPPVEPYATDMRALIARNGVPRIAFAGPAYGAARDAHLARADLFVLPSRSENFGMAIAEALAAGVPVLCTKGAPWPGIVAHECGFWTDLGAEALVNALRRALSLSPQELLTMGARGRRWMESSFSWDAQGRKMAQTYDWLLGRGPQPDHVSTVGATEDGPLQP